MSWVNVPSVAEFVTRDATLRQYLPVVAADRLGEENTFKFYQMDVTLMRD